MIAETRIQNLLSRWEAASGSISPEDLCADCPELLPQVRDCISHLRSSDKHLAEADAEAPRPPEIPGYEILRYIGRGGMGIVWRARQLSTKREVAMKAIAAGEFASPRSRARFEREIELASRLAHVNIARVYESALHDGLLYYAMELIEGARLDDYVAEKKLNRDEILGLFLPICAAVQHAHQLGVIHRDLKPGNILVDNNGQPHLLDFGLAKGVLADVSPQITQEDTPGTPAFMSPEQASGQLRRVGTASDVYALGVTLYLLLLKQFPHDVSGSSIEVMNRIATQDPVRPRAVDADFPRDLEAIILKSLAREPEERYASADEFARDIDRFLHGLPCAPLGRWYHAIKFVRRHKYKLVTTASVLAIVCAIGIVAYMNVVRQRNRAETNEAIATEVNRFLLDMLASADPEASGRPVPTLPELLDRASARIDGAFPDRPLVEAAIRSTLGKTYVLLAFAAKAETHLRRSYDLRLRQLGPHHPETLVSVGDLAQCLYNDDRHIEAERILRPAIDAARKDPGLEDERTLDLMDHLAATLYYQLRRGEVAQLAQEIYETNLRVHGPNDRRTIVASENFATALAGDGQFAEAERVVRDALSRMPADPQFRASRLCHTYLKLGGALAGQGKLAEAEDAFTRCVDTRVALYGPRHNMVAYAKYQLAKVKAALGKLDEAEKLIGDAIDIDESERPDSTSVVVDYMCAAQIYQKHGKPDLTAEMTRRARRVAEARLTSEVPADPLCINAYGDGLFELGMHDLAADYLTRAIEHANRSLPPEHSGLKRIIQLRDRARAATTQPATSNPAPAMQNPKN